MCFALPQALTKNMEQFTGIRSHGEWLESSSSLDTIKNYLHINFRSAFFIRLCPRCHRSCSAKRYPRSRQHQGQLRRGVGLQPGRALPGNARPKRAGWKATRAWLSAGPPNLNLLARARTARMQIGSHAPLRTRATLYTDTISQFEFSFLKVNWLKTELLAVFEPSFLSKLWLGSCEMSKEYCIIIMTVQNSPKTLGARQLWMMQWGTSTLNAGILIGIGKLESY